MRVLSSELLARVCGCDCGKVVPRPARRDDILDAGGVLLDLRTRQATVSGRQVDLSAREFTLTEIFMLNPGQVLSREQLLDHVWGYDFDRGPTWWVDALREHGAVGAEGIEPPTSSL